MSDFTIELILYRIFPGNHVFPGNIKFSCRLSHHPILGHYELIKKMKKKTPQKQPRQRKSLLWIRDAFGDLTLWAWEALMIGSWSLPSGNLT